MFKHIVTAKKYKFLLKQLVIRDFKVKYKRSALGVLWSLLNPLFTMMIFNVVFSELFKVEIENYLIYLLSGLVVFNFFSEATTQALSSVTGNFSLINKVYVPKYIFPISKVLSTGINLVMSLIALYLIIIVSKTPISSTHYFLPFLVICLLVFTMGVSLILSALMVFFRDMQFLYSVIIMMWMYLTPIMYPISIFPKKYFYIMTLNPMYHYVSYMRSIILDNTIPSISTHITCSLIAIVTLLVGALFFKKSQSKFVGYM